MSDGIKKIIVNLDALQMKAPKKQTKKLSTIVPNRLKDTFLKQVQHHKSLANAQKKQLPVVDPIKYTDDFNSSVEYLNNIKKNIQAVHSELPIELMDEPTNSNVPDLRPKLVESISNANNSNTNPTPSLITPPLVSTKYAVDSAVPYGCLKNGIKPSFKNWTRSNRPKPCIATTTTNPVQSLSFSSNTTPPPIPNVNTSVNGNANATISTSISEQSNNTNNTKPNVPLTTIKRHVIGKSKKSRHVGVLIKNVNTRKMIINAHRDLKKINIHEVRNHLKNNGLLKVGTTAPIEVLRQTYEASILAGNINNKNDETLYHNFVNDNKEI